MDICPICKEREKGFDNNRNPRKTCLLCSHKKKPECRIKTNQIIYNVCYFCENKYQVFKNIPKSKRFCSKLCAEKYKNSKINENWLKKTNEKQRRKINPHGTHLYDKEPGFFKKFKSVRG